MPNIYAPDSLETGGEMVFFLQPRGGLTRRLAAAATKQPDVGIKVLMEGPYGGMPERWYEGFDRTLIVAGGSGCGFTLALVEDWIRRKRLLDSGFNKQLEVVLATRDPEMRIWYMEELQRIVKAPYLSSLTEIKGLSIRFHETHLTSDPDVQSPAPNGLSSDDEEKNAGKEATEITPRDDASSTTDTLFGIKFFQGRPDVGEAVTRCANQSGATVGVSVCGPSSMLHDVNKAAADAQRRIASGDKTAAAELLLHTESFSY